MVWRLTPLRTTREVWEERAAVDHSVMYRSPNKVFRYQINKLRLMVNEWVNQSPGPRVLEIGCGDGYITAGFRGKEVVALDISQRRIERAKGKCNAFFLVADGNGIFPFAAESFDITVVVGVFEYLQEAPRFFEEVGRVSKRRGEMILSFPSRTLVRRRVADGTGYTESSLREVVALLRNAGYRVDRTTNIGLNWPEAGFARPLQWLERWFPRFVLTRSILLPKGAS